MAKAITKDQANKISHLFKQFLHAEQVIRENRPREDDFAKQRVAESIEYSKQVRNTLHDEFGILWHHESA